MATPIRKKRNFKALQLSSPSSPVSPIVVAPPEPVPAPAPAPAPTAAPAPSVAPLMPTRQAPAPGGKRRPPPMTLKAPKIPTNPAPVETGGQLLTVVSGSSSAPNTASPMGSTRRSTYATLSNTLANLDINAETKYDLRNEDLKEMQELGQGNGGSVKKVRAHPHRHYNGEKGPCSLLPTAFDDADRCQVVLIDAKPAVRKQILRELQIMHNCHSKYIISFYGAYLADPNICICMEFMDKGSLDGIYKKIGAIDIDIVGKVALAVLEGLTYLYDVHRIIHRDIKPSNILCNSQGDIKICDFGVSGELINSIADTFVGTSTYMSPERIQGAQYTVKSDVWSLGISLIELALGRFPFSESDDDSDSDLSEFENTLSPARPGSMGSIAALSLPQSRKDRKSAAAKKDRRKSKGVSLQGGGMTMSILELLQHIVNEPAPRLTPEGSYAKGFIGTSTRIPSSNHEWIKHAKRSKIDVEEWANTF
ncbi:Pkinase-domain-containing protein [Hymenopellis radicata]|nr:Pkinase-domain-containing protein [Hymenopellis radicata]